MLPATALRIWRQAG